MLSTIITIALWFVITELHINKKEEAQASPLMDIINEARDRYVAAYKLDPTAGDKAKVFDEVIRRSSFVNGTFKFSDAYTFKQILVDAHSKSYYGNIRKSEALFVYDFVMEGYREVATHLPKLNFDINLTQMKECV